MEINKLKVAIVHDFLTQFGGAERVLEALCEMFPDAPIYTLLYDKEKMRGKFADKVVFASFLQKFPKFLRKRHKYLLPLMPTAPETFDLREFDLVISSSGAWSKGIVVRLDTIHISYIHSPMRFVWDANGEYLQQQEKGWGMNFLARSILNYIRIWDKSAADRPDFLIANSQYTQARIKKYYGRESAVIYPPVDVDRGSHNVDRAENDTRYAIRDTRPFLIVSRLSPYKKVDVVVEAFNKLGLPLIVIGEGSHEKYLRSIAGENIQFLGWQSDEQVQKYYQNARAFIFAGVDDFGIAPVEAMSFGTPVLAIRKGGVKEIVLEGQTGEFFEAATPEVIADGVRRFMENEKSYDRQIIINRAKEFSKERFIKELSEYIDKIN
ncbi:MAG: glycosyltransferase [Parcubacteria group bacterium]|jgi:glycosyltransferase involved in cell wall biosynthesis